MIWQSLEVLWTQILWSRIKSYRAIVPVWVVYVDLHASLSESIVRSPVTWHSVWAGNCPLMKGAVFKQPPPCPALARDVQGGSSPDWSKAVST